MDKQDALVPRDKINDDTMSAVYTALFRMALDGRSVKRALSDLSIKTTTFYAWRRDHADEYLILQQQAREEADQYRKDQDLRVASQRLFAQQQLELKLIEAMPEIVTQVVDIAKTAESDQTQLRAAHMVRTWIRDGTLVRRTPREDRELQVAEVPAPSFNPHNDTLLGHLDLPPGSKIEITTPEAPLEQA